MIAAAFVFVFLVFLFFFLLHLDTKLFPALVKARAPDPVKDPSLPHEEQLLRALKQHAENLKWLESKECERAVFIPGTTLWYYIRDHYIRRQPWKPSRNV
jgi:hypothetical protein